MDMNSTLNVPKQIDKFLDELNNELLFEFIRDDVPSKLEKALNDNQYKLQGSQTKHLLSEEDDNETLVQGVERLFESL